MRTICTLLLVLLITYVQAQVPIEVKVEQRPSSLGVQPAFEVMVPQATDDDAVDLWKKTILPGGLFKKEPKMDKVKDEWIVNNVLISDISVRSLNVFTQVNSFPGHIYVRIFLQTENGFLGSDSVAGDVDAASRFIRNYAVELYRQAVEKELRKEEKELKELENNLTRLDKQNRNLNDKISDAEKDEVDLKNEARQNEEVLRNQQNVIPLDSADPNEKKSVKEQLEKQVKDTEKDIEKSQKDQIKFSKKVSKNEREQRSKESALEKQKMKVEEVKQKLNNIK